MQSGNKVFWEGHIFIIDSILDGQIILRPQSRYLWDADFYVAQAEDLDQIEDQVFLWETDHPNQRIFQGVLNV